MVAEALWGPCCEPPRLPEALQASAPPPAPDLPGGPRDVEAGEAGEAAKAAQAEPAKRRCVLKCLAGEGPPVSHYESPTLRELFSVVPIVSVAVYCMAKSGVLLAPARWFRYLATFDPVFAAFSVMFWCVPHIMYAMTWSRRHNTLLVVMTAVLHFPSGWYFQNTVPGNYLAACLFVLVTGSVAKQRTIQLFCVFCMFPSTAIYHFMIMTAARWTAGIQWSLLRVAILPVASTITSVVIAYGTAWVFQKVSKPPGLPRYSWALVMGCGQVLAEDMRIGGFLANAHRPMNLAGACVTTIACELLSRFPLWYMWLRRLGLASELTPVEDVRLRLRFSVPLLPLIPAVVAVRVAEAAGAPWANALCWLAIALYAASNVLCDLVVVLVHWRCYKERDSLVGTWQRLVATPQSHWPSFQPAPKATSSDNVFVSPLHNCLGLPDVSWLALQLHLCAALFVWAVLSGLFGECYVIKHPDQC